MKSNTFYDRLLRSCDEPCWDIDCRGLSDFDLGVIESLSLKGALLNPTRRKVLREWLNRSRLRGMVAAHVFPPARWATLKRYRALYEAAATRRDFRYAFLSGALRDHETLLDVGCGTAPWFGRLSVNHGYFGVDLSAGMVQASVRRHGARFALADGVALPFRAGQFDACCCFGVLPFVRNIEPLLEQLCVVGRSLIAFDVIDGNRPGYVSPWSLSSFFKHYLGIGLATYQVDIPAVVNQLQLEGFELAARETFVDGVTDSMVALAFRR